MPLNGESAIRNRINKATSLLVCQLFFFKVNIDDFGLKQVFFNSF